MQPSTAKVVDFQAYRLSRAATARRDPEVPTQPNANPVQLFWCPVWMFVPVMMVPN